MKKLDVRRIKKTFADDTVVALQDVSLHVDEGEFISLLGPSGCGKSTLLNMVSGLSLPDEGEILLNGRSIVGQRGQVSYMPQKDALFPWRTVLDNVIVPLEVQGISRKDARREALELLPLFGLDGFASSYPSALSGGMRQRASFLRTYLDKKEVMLLDEPFASLDEITRMRMHEWLMEIWQKFRRSIIFVTHNIDEAILLSDRIYVFSARPGRVVAEVEVNLPRPRNVRSSTSARFTSLKNELLDYLSEPLDINKPLSR